MSRAGNVLENPVTGERAVAGEQQISRERADDQPPLLFEAGRIQTRENERPRGRRGEDPHGGRWARQAPERL